jgi:endo-1,4-beta-xylanase
MNKKKRIIVLFTALICFIAAELYAQKDISLKEVFKDYFLIGTAVNRFQLSGNDTLAVSIVKDQFNTITAENVYGNMFTDRINIILSRLICS